MSVHKEEDKGEHKPIPCGNAECKGCSLATNELGGKGQGEFCGAKLYVKKEDVFCSDCGKGACKTCPTMAGCFCTDCGRCFSPLEDSCQKCQPKRYSDMKIERAVKGANWISFVTLLFAVTSTTLSCLSIFLLGLLWANGAFSGLLALLVFIILPIVIAATFLSLKDEIVRSRLLCIPGELNHEEAVEASRRARKWDKVHYKVYKPFIRMDYH